MRVLHQESNKLPPNNAVPSPAEGDQMVSRRRGTLPVESTRFGRTACPPSAAWSPLVPKISRGKSPISHKFGPSDDEESGSKTQEGSEEGSGPTRFGNPLAFADVRCQLAGHRSGRQLGQERRVWMRTVVSCLRFRAPTTNLSAAEVTCG